MYFKNFQVFKILTNHPFIFPFLITHYICWNTWNNSLYGCATWMWSQFSDISKLFTCDKP